VIFCKQDIDLRLSKEYHNIRKNLKGVVTVDEFLAGMELKLQEKFPQGSTDEEVEEFCYNHGLFTGTEKKTQFIKHIYRKKD